MIFCYCSAAGRLLNGNDFFMSEMAEGQQKDEHVFRISERKTGR